jgi:hypothetical protein
LVGLIRKTTGGTVFSAEVKTESEEVTVIMVKDGRVGISNPAVSPEEVTVSDLQKTIVRKGKFPTLPVALTAAEIALFAIIADLLSAGAAAGVTAAGKGISTTTALAIAGGAVAVGGIAALAGGGGGGDGGDTTSSTTTTTGPTGRESVTWNVNTIESGAGCFACNVIINVRNTNPGATVSASSSWGASDSKTADSNGMANLSLSTPVHCPCLSGRFTVSVGGTEIFSASDECF